MKRIISKAKEKPTCDLVKLGLKDQFEETMSGKGTSRVPWHLVDWSHQDIEISESFSCSRERVRQKRLELGKSRPKNWHCRRGSAREKISELKDTSNMTLKEIASKVCCSNSYALQTLKKLGKSYKRQKLGGKTKYDWASADWSKSYSEIAEDLGIDNPGVVSQYRQRHGISREKQQVVEVEEPVMV
jgi:hypothetical protein